jgi:hypothetical protein
VVSVVSTVVGARLDALDRFFGFELRCCCYCLLEPAEHFPAPGGSVCWENHPLCSDRLMDLVKKGWFWGEDEEEGVIRPPRSAAFGSESGL